MRSTDHFRQRVRATPRRFLPVSSAYSSQSSQIHMYNIVLLIQKHSLFSQPAGQPGSHSRLDHAPPRRLDRTEPPSVWVPGDRGPICRLVWNRLRGPIYRPVRPAQNTAPRQLGWTPLGRTGAGAGGGSASLSPSPPPLSLSLSLSPAIRRRSVTGGASVSDGRRIRLLWEPERGGRRRSLCIRAAGNDRSAVSHC